MHGIVRSDEPRTLWPLSVLVVLLIMAAAVAFSRSSRLLIGQVISAKESGAAVPPTAAHIITLDVVVTDRSGIPVPGLQQQDFTLLDNKRPQAIVSFNAVDSTHKAVVPPQAVIVLDSLNNSNGGVAVLRQQLRSHFQQSGGELPLATFLVFFPDTAREQAVASRDGNALVQYLDSNKSGISGLIRAQGEAGAADRTQASLRTITQLISSLASVPGRKLLIWLGTGWPLLAGEDLDVPHKGQASLFNHIVWLSDSLRKSRITVYNVGINQGAGVVFDYEHFLKGVSSANGVQYGDIALEVLAVQSGGQVLKYNNDLVGSLARCQEDAKVYYTLSFEAPPAGHPDEYHSLQVKISRPRLTARTRTGYYDWP